MHTTTAPRPGSSLLTIIEGLRDDVRNLFHEEVQLAKKEVSEKASRLGRNALYMAIGGVVAYLAVILLFVALSFLVAYAFQAINLNAIVSIFLGFLVMALICGAVGAVLVAKAIKAFSKESLAPEKTIESLREIKAGGLEQTPLKVTYHTPEQPKDSRTSDQVRSDIAQTRSRIRQEVAVLRRRLTVARFATGMVTRVSHNPVRTVGIGLGTGLAGFVLMRVARLFGRRRAY